MITKINLNSVTCYKCLATLETDKKINLIYGLNGTGKSTLSEFLYDRSSPAFSNCSVEGLNSEDILVYNQSFIRDNFYQSDNLKGIFTLSKENKGAEEKVKEAEKEITKFENEKTKKTNAIENHNTDLSKKNRNAANKTWEIKTNYAGGDRVLEYCLAGLMGRKESLYKYLSEINKPLQKLGKSTDQLKKEVESIQGSAAKKYGLLSTITFSANQVESNQLFQKVIIGNESSPVSGLIKKLENSDWVKQGIDYLPEEIAVEGVLCPFCQEKTITKTLVESIKNYFDKTYENDIGELKKSLSEYKTGFELLPKKEEYELNPFIVEKKSEFENQYNAIIQCLVTNQARIEEKLKTPSQKITLIDSKNKIKTFNHFIGNINNAIIENNIKIDNKDASLAAIKKEFWKIMRWDYDQTIAAYNNDKSSIESKIKDLRKEIKNIETDISAQIKIVKEQQKKTVNIEESINNINNALIELGIESFKIEKHSDILYKIARAEQCENTFKTLSEGEKMIISFLYFRELCKGKKTAISHSNKKIVVIDDPISSLSHIYVFNVGQLIKNDFFKSNYEQIFVLTHSLYFFYELTDPNHNRRKQTQKLFRMTKNCDGGHISRMKYEEIQNDYHSYWFVIKDEKQPPALIANCMRNIIEYFFNFIERQDLNNVFQKPELQKTKYQAFCRYINRESHSLGQNIFDFKEFNYADFREALSLVFLESGYKEHYDKMMK